MPHKQQTVTRSTTGHGTGHRAAVEQAGLSFPSLGRSAITLHLNPRSGTWRREPGPRRVQPCLRAPGSPRGGFAQTSTRVGTQLSQDDTISVVFTSQTLTVWPWIFFQRGVRGYRLFVPASLQHHSSPTRLLQGNAVSRVGWRKAAVEGCW